MSLLKQNKIKPLNVMFGDLGYFNRQTVHNQYLPLGIGLIAQYSKQEFGNEIEVSLFKNDASLFSLKKIINFFDKNPKYKKLTSKYTLDGYKTMYL